MNNKNLTIGVLTITGLILFIAQFLPLQVAHAEETIKDRDYSLVTARSTGGGDNIYVVDNRTGQMAVFSWDPAQRNLVFSGVGPLSAAFAR